MFFSVKELLQDLKLQIAYQLDDYLVSHAGFNLIFDPKEWHFNLYTKEYEEELELLPNQDFPKQIVGHTPKESIDISKNVIGIDTFSLYIDKDNKYQFIGNGDLLVYDQGHFEVISTDWATDKILKQLPQLQI
ncbi:Ser/Thr protein phosphatase family protein [Streptococcus pneumoniae]|nr:Ser/Thr protein phosphatase family protein [Streptococcus pneumoniae]